MFLADIVLYGGYYLIALVFGLLAAIPYIGIIFGFIYFVFALCFIAFQGIFVGLYSAAFFKMPQPQPQYYNPYQNNVNTMNTEPNTYNTQGYNN